jgi:hypothetical protein
MLVVASSPVAPPRFLAESYGLVSARRHQPGVRMG